MYPQTGREGDQITFTLAAGDLDSDPILYTSLSPLPSGAAFVTKSGKFIWTPNYDQAGEYILRFGAVDPSGAVSTTDVKLSIANVNRPPVVDVSNHVAILGVPLVFSVAATDPDAGTILTYSFTGLPEGATYNTATGQVRWIAGPGQAGDYLVRAIVTDGKTEVTEPFIIRASTDPVVPSVLIELTPSFPVLPGQQVLAHVIATGFIDVTSIRLIVDGQQLELDDKGRARFNAGGPGKITLIAEATDADGNVGRITKELKVRDPGDTLAPIVGLDVAQFGSTITAATTLRGTVADTNLDSWKLEIARFNDDHFSLLATGATPVAGTLMQFDPGLYEDGFYRPASDGDRHRWPGRRSRVAYRGQFGVEAGPLSAQ